MDLNAIAIIVVFGAILAITLSKYLLGGQPKSARDTSSNKPASSISQEDLEAVAERVYRVINKLEVLERRVSDLNIYVGQMVADAWRKRVEEREVR
ncbi:MAG: hypothetical protein NZ932_03950 [Candidatus Bathyarchaeota archaeon]|nr:hypothetical protein [Candidatus Bathyarchaeota archaeon]MDW8022378.1 hypothetical protein [Nitrososphaerota archaeon]